MDNRLLFWEQGVFLQPQHFQIAQRQQADARALFGALLQPHCWGVFRLKINEDALAAEIFEITELGLLLKDGEWMDYPGNATLAPRPFRAAWQNPEAPLAVHVGLAPFREEGDNVFPTDEPETAPDVYRFTTPLSADPAPDLHGQGAAADVRALRFRLRLCFDDEMQGSLLRIPVARLVRSGERVRLDSHFTPPVVDIQAAGVLVNMLRDVRDVLLSRARQLEEFKLAGGDASSSEVSSLYGITLFCVLGAISRHVPELDQLLLAPRMHPWPVFVALCRMVGELSVFSATLSPLGEVRQGPRALPAYDHKELYECFSAACGIVTRLVDSLVVGPDFAFVLEARDGFLCTQMPQSARNNSYGYWLLLRSHAAPDLAERARAFGKLAPQPEMANIVARALPGIRLVHADTPPVGLPRRKDTAYFMVDQADPLWEQGLQHGEIAFFLPDAPPDLWVQLTVIRR
ncbi:MAG: type VI secretion system baseplate subunit TssK [Candidatus Accumulibacter sp.]|nr:type VI secretion system baseplate subunit TssK [Accumulibacter sp.]